MRSRRVTVIGLVLAGALAYGAWPCKARTPNATTASTPALAPTPVVEQPPVRSNAAPIRVQPPVRANSAPIRVHPPAPAPEELPPLIAARWSAIEAMVRDGDVAELPKLCASELAKEPEAAPAIIHGVASLAVQGSDSDRALAGKTLARWLSEERKRDTRDASGNVVNIVEALGDLGGDDAVASLVDVLDREEDVALQTTAAERLATLGDARALPAVMRFGERLSRSPEPTDAFEKELRAEAIKAAADARARLKKEPNE